MTMAAIVYALCALTSVLCAALLVRSWLRTRVRLLLWSSLCFVALALNNVLLFLDLVLITSVDLTGWRSGLALAGLTVLVGGLVEELR